MLLQIHKAPVNPGKITHRCGTNRSVSLSGSTTFVRVDMARHPKFFSGCLEVELLLAATKQVFVMDLSSPHSLVIYDVHVHLGSINNRTLSVDHN